MDNELIREVNEAVKQDRLHALWQSFGDKIIYFSIAIIVLTTGSIYWQKSQQNTRQERTDMLIQGYELYSQQKYAQASLLFAELGKDAESAMAGIAKLWQAKVALKEGNKEAALNAYASALESKGTAQKSVHSYACLQGFMLSSDDERFRTCLPSLAKEAFFPAAAEAQIAIELTDGEGSYTLLQTLPESVTIPKSQQQRMTDIRIYIDSSQTEHAE